MVSKEHKIDTTLLHDKLHQLGSITHSHAVNETSIIMDASKYIAELKEKVERLKQDFTTKNNIAQSSSSQDSLPTVIVETLEKGFLINVLWEKSCPGLLICILEAFEELKLNVVRATASCTHYFQMEAIIEEGEGQGGEAMDAKYVGKAVYEAIRHWSQSNDQND